MLIEIKNCKSGYILKGEKNHKVVDGIKGHFMIFYKPMDDRDFEGAMITSTDYDNENVAMKQAHFQDKFESGKECKLKYNNSHLVPAKLRKYSVMGPFELVGQLTKEGLQFVDANIGKLKLEDWDEYLDRINTTIK